MSLSEVIERGRTLYSYDSADELVQTRGPGQNVRFRYDANSNQIEAGASDYRYDLANRLVSVKGGGKLASSARMATARARRR